MTNELVETTLRISAIRRKLYDEIVQELINKLPEGTNYIKVSEFAENNRVLPNDTPKPGPWSNKLTPLLVEPMDCLSADNPIQELAILKSGQDGVTAAIPENLIAYTIAVNPVPILYITSSDMLARKWYDLRFIPLINSIGVDNLIQYQQKTKRKNKVGTTAQLTHFPGGYFAVGSGQNPIAARSLSFCIVILDEISTYPDMIKREGDFPTLAQTRTTTYPDRKKIVYLSTPTDFGSCPMTEIFLQGDQRYAFIKCPYCGKEIVLEFNSDYAPYHTKANLLEKEFGLVWKMDGRQLIPESVGYLCVECHQVIKQHQQYDLMQKAQWHPTAISRDKLFRSYSYSGLYSLLTDWVTIVKSWIWAGNNEARKQSFVNTKLGIAYRVQTIKPKPAKLLSLKGNYRQREVPNGVLFLTGAIDVQQGSRTNPDYSARLEMEVCGFGRKYKSWSIEYRKFIGSVDHYDSGAWAQLRDYFKNEFEYVRNDGVKFRPVIFGIDARNSKDRNNVFAIARLYSFVFPIMGSKPLKRDQALADQIDEESFRDYDPFRISKSSDQTVILASTNHYKKLVYQALRVERQLGEQNPYFCEFPQEYNEKYFRDLTSEEMDLYGNFILPSGKHNEPLDLRVYNLCMHDLFLYQQIIQIRKQFEQRKYDREEVKRKVKSPYVLSLLEKKITNQMKRRGFAV